MDKILLTRDAKRLQKCVYKAYKKKRKSGTLKHDAIRFGSSKEIQKHLFPKWSASDVDAACQELHNAGLLSCFFADGIAYFVVLTDLGIVQMEQRFTGPIKAILNFLQTLIGEI